LGFRADPALRSGRRAAVPPEGFAVEAWQITVLILLVLFPFALLFDYWPDRERLTRTGAPVEREWKRQIVHEPHDEHH
jgi:hypothetical protein